MNALVHECTVEDTRIVYTVDELADTLTGWRVGSFTDLVGAHQVQVIRERLSDGSQVRSVRIIELPAL